MQTITIQDLLAALLRAQATLEAVRIHWEPIGHVNREAMKQAVAADHEALSNTIATTKRTADAAQALLLHRIERLEKDAASAGRICSDHEQRLSELLSMIQGVARNARVQDKLNEHGFDAFAKSITALQQQARKTPRNRNRNK